MPTILLIRHGESQSNAGLPTSNPEFVELTQRGKEQAQNIADFLNSYYHPDLIVTSSYLRAKQTASPTTLLFPHISQEWPVHEFTYLSSWHKAPSTVEDRREWVRQYWELSNPTLIDSSALESELKPESESESFEQFIKRVQKVMEALKTTTYDKVVVFSHQQLICALLWLSEQGPLELCPDTMRNFKEFLTSHPIPNGGIVPVHFEDCNDKWHIGPTITSHLLEPALGRK